MIQEYLKNVDKIQSDATTLKDSSKIILENCIDRVKIETRQTLRSLDRRLNRIVRRQSRLMKCEKKNGKLEEFEGIVDKIMDWIYDTEVLMTCVVESTHAAVKERVDQFEVRHDFLHTIEGLP